MNKPINWERAWKRLIKTHKLIPHSEIISICSDKDFFIQLERNGNIESIKMPAYCRQYFPIVKDDNNSIFLEKNRLALQKIIMGQIKRNRKKK